MNLTGKTVVITGASSGIGRATALAFARHGCTIVASARRQNALDEVARDCMSIGAKATAVAADVTDAQSVQQLAAAAREFSGAIHVWINNAGVGVFGAFPEGGVELHRRVIETNLIGAIHGAAAALPAMRRQGEGVIVNLSSVGGLVPVPYAATYAASKAGLRAFAISLREELRNEPDIHVCTALPSFVDTPAIEHHGANVTGRELRPSGPILAPDYVASRLVDLVQVPRAELDIGWPTSGARIGGAISPTLAAWFGGLAVRRYLSRAKPAPSTRGNLMHPVPEGTAASGTLRRGR